MPIPFKNSSHFLVRETMCSLLVDFARAARYPQKTNSGDILHAERVPDMNGDDTTQLQLLIDRLQQGDDSARRELIGCAYERLRLLARKMLHTDFPRLQNLHATGSVLDEAALRLLTALQEVTVHTVQDFFSFAAMQMRRVLIDMARRQRRDDPGVNLEAPAKQDSSQTRPPFEEADTTWDPAQLAIWTEFHEKVGELPEKERSVVDLHWYQGLTQAETAQLLGMSPSDVSRCWMRARLKLLDCVRGLEQLL
jgi:RNA polymerase sigma factor (TIGR02999 family)